MAVENPIKKGYLLFQPQGVFNIKKSWQKKYCALFRSSNYGIERLEVFDSEEDASTSLSPRIITLENCIKITPEPQKLEANVFMVVTRTATHYFASVEENEKSDWLSAFQCVAFKENVVSSIIEEDNDLYCSSNEGVFFVNLVQSEASSRCGLEPGAYMLLLTPSAIELRDQREPKFRVQWPYCYIRRYGYADGRFTFEAGRLCETGEGKFLLEHSNQQEIYRSLTLKMKSMRKLLEGDVNLQSAVGMGPRSRSPIPVSPPMQDSQRLLKSRAASQGNIFEKAKPLVSPSVETNPLIVINAPPYLKPRGLSASHGALDALARKSPTLFHAKLVDIETQPESAPPLQPKSAKSPRRPSVPEKRLFWKGSAKSCARPSDADYDDVEVREEAWKTLGLDEPEHTEDYEPVETVELTARVCEAPPVLPVPPPTRPKFLPVKPTSEWGNYNTLQYFGSGKGSSKGEYKQIVVSPSSSITPDSPTVLQTFHDYDEVAEPMTVISSITGLPSRAPEDFSPIHPGYGTIRRLPEHRLFNNLEYATVTKPRQV